MLIFGLGVAQADATKIKKEAKKKVSPFFFSSRGVFRSFLFG